MNLTRNNSNFRGGFKNRAKSSMSVQRVNKLWNKSTKTGLDYGIPSTTEISYTNQPHTDLNYKKFQDQQRFHYEPHGVAVVTEKKKELFNHKPIVEKDIEKFIPRYNYYKGKSPAREYEEKKSTFSTHVKLGRTKELKLDQKINISV
jgi:hypothetical protein